MAKILADVKEKIDLLEETEEAKKGRNWKWWVITPLGVAALACGAFLVVRRRFNKSEQ